MAQQTRHWDESAGKTVPLRSKEEAFDYRYFPEPDLVPVVPDATWQAQVGHRFGPLPADRRAKLTELFGADVPASRVDQIVTVVELGLDDLVVAAAAAGVDPGLGFGPHGQ